MRRPFFRILLILLCGIISGSLAEDAPWVFTCGDYQYTLLPGGGAEIVRYLGNEAELIVPAQLQEHDVLRIGESAFYGQESLDSVILPKGLTSIGDYAFYKCNYLVTVVLPDGLQSIGDHAFDRCSFLMSINLPEGLKHIGDYAIDGCSDQSILTLPEGLQSIGDYAFPKYEEITSITLPDSIREMGANPFISCDKLKDIRVSPDHPYLAVIDDVLFSKPDKRLICYPNDLQAASYTIPKGIKIIGDSAFYKCNLSSITFPGGVEIIGDSAFAETIFSSVTLPKGLKTIGNRAFAGSFDLKSITIPEGVQSIGDKVFAACEYLDTVTFPDSIRELGTNPFVEIWGGVDIQISPDHPYLEVIDGVLFSKPDKRLIYYPPNLNYTVYVIPEGTKIIGDHAFFWCDSLTAVILPEGLQSIGDSAFLACNALTSVVLPESVETIGKDAFAAFQDVELTVIKGSYAHQYAKENGYSYVYPDSYDWLLD